MPLKPGSSHRVIRQNARMLMDEGRPEDQAWAIAYRNAGRARAESARGALRARAHAKKRAQRKG